MNGMSTMATDAGRVPDWTIGDRLAKALRANNIGVQAMATDLGVSRNTVTNYIHDKTRVPRPILILWAMRTGVSLSWLETGDPPVTCQRRSSR
jgi:transcriptional regulator with XRE-family HTH domain